MIPDPWVPLTVHKIDFFQLMIPNNNTHRKIKRLLWKCHFQQSLRCDQYIIPGRKVSFHLSSISNFCHSPNKKIPRQNQPIYAFSHADISKNHSCHPQQKTNRIVSNIHQIKPLPYFFEGGNRLHVPKTKS